MNKPHLVKRGNYWRCAVRTSKGGLVSEFCATPACAYDKLIARLYRFGSPTDESPPAQ